MYRWLLSLHGYYIIKDNRFDLSECTCTYRNYIFSSIWYRAENATRGNSGELAYNKVQRVVVQCLVLHEKDYTGCSERASRNTSTIPTSDNKCGQSLQCEANQVIVRYRDW